MKDLLLYIARSLVEHPEQVSVTEVEEGDELTLQLRVARRRREFLFFLHRRALRFAAFLLAGVGV